MKIKKLKNITPKIRIPRTLSPKSWKHEASGTQGNVTLFGVNIFSCGWKLTGKTARVQHPNHGHDFKFPVYSVDIDGRQKEFAAGQDEPFGLEFFPAEILDPYYRINKSVKKTAPGTCGSFSRISGKYTFTASAGIMHHSTICNTKYSPSIEK